jgi:hypothetical protein
MNSHTTSIMGLEKVDLTTAQIRKAIKLAQTFIANGYSWEVAL